MALLRENDCDGGIDRVAKKKWRSPEAEYLAVGLDMALNSEGAGDTFLLAHTFGIRISVAAEMTLLGQSTVQQNAKGVISGAEDSC